MADILLNLSLLSFILAFMFLIAAVVLWFLLKIPRVIGDLSGRTARKSIAIMRETGGRCLRSDSLEPREFAANLYERQGNKLRNSLVDSQDKGDTEVLHSNYVASGDYEETVILEDETVLLSSNESFVQENAITEEAKYRGTDEKSFSREKQAHHNDSDLDELRLIEEIEFVHTSEKI